MNILGLSQKNSGCGYHRVVLPLAYMEGIKGYVTNIPSDETIDSYNYLLYNRISVLDKNIHVLKDKGYKIILDLDDDWILPPSHILYENYLTLAPQIEINIKNADLVTVTNERIYNRVKNITDKVEILPNALPYGVNQFTDITHEADKVRIFWCGSITHDKDIALLKMPFKRLNAHKNVQMVIGGFNHSNDFSKYLWERMWKDFTDHGKLDNLILPSCDPTDYMKLYEHADIVVIPLEKSGWHAAKSNLKILEAAAKKLPVIVSAVEPYILDEDAPVLWVRNQSDWYKHLNNLINNKNLREDYGQKIFEWAKTKYNYFEINERRKQLFESI
jgi:glycosyltransferase involved in cell wall biosynthesis